MSSSINEVDNKNAANRILENFGFSAAQSATLLSISETGEAKDGDIIFKEGSDFLAPVDSSRIYLIISGDVTVSKGNQPFYSATTGDFLGERRFLELEVLDFLGRLRSNPIEEIFAIVDEDKSGAVHSGDSHPFTHKRGEGGRKRRREERQRKDPDKPDRAARCACRRAPSPETDYLLY
jgi:hypothetical protein